MDNDSHLGVLDGLRGAAALWVVLGHAALLTGCPIPLLKHPDLAVDLFILLSGFLMTYHYEDGVRGRTWVAPLAWLEFWIRRYFRISPLYYLILIVALFIEPVLWHSRGNIDLAIPSAGTPLSRYHDTSFPNILAHFGFFFGLLPKFAFETPLPDWSIGLEMAFYGAFPAIMLAFRKAGPVWASVGIALGCCLLWHIARPFLIHFSEPSFLSLKLPIFLAGALVAAAMRRRRIYLLGVALALTAMPAMHLGWPLYVIARICLAALLIWLVYWPGKFGAAALSQVLASRLGKWLGDTSYGVYLIHLLLMLPLAAWADQRFPTNSSLRWLVVAAGTAAGAYPIAYTLFRTVENPGHALGKRLARQLRPTRPVEG